jgi:hypothetical protein
LRYGAFYGEGLPLSALSPSAIHHYVHLRIMIVSIAEMHQQVKPLGQAEQLKRLGMPYCLLSPDQ